MCNNPIYKFRYDFLTIFLSLSRRLHDINFPIEAEDGKFWVTRQIVWKKKIGRENGFRGARVQSPWNQFFLDNELRLTIKQDVIRT